MTDDSAHIKDEKTYLENATTMQASLLPKKKDGRRRKATKSMCADDDGIKTRSKVTQSTRERPQNAHKPPRTKRIHSHALHWKSSEATIGSSTHFEIALLFFLGCPEILHFIWCWPRRLLNPGLAKSTHSKRWWWRCQVLILFKKWLLATSSIFSSSSLLLIICKISGLFFLHLHLRVCSTVLLQRPVRLLLELLPTTPLFFDTKHLFSHRAVCAVVLHAAN